ncbi:cell division protein FtsQ/DivIB [Membranihabitans marinus]|uniref:cell division protein FtsQ/DivIB n=1 Tax=Membranihabitans marinus TaxID=1227546 RepID=UPI001F39C14B|nr:hypothetical protein [Membranihabitans marinus]
MVDKQHIKRLGYLLASCLFIIGVGILFASFGSRSDAKVSGIEMIFEEQKAAENLLDSADIVRSIHTIYPKGVVGLEAKDLKLDSMEVALRNNPFVDHVELYLDKNAKLRIEVQEKSPLLRVLSLKGDNLYIDRQGWAMPLSDHYTARVVVVTGHLPKIVKEVPVDSVAILNNIFEIAKAIDRDKFMSDFISEIHVDHQSKITLIPVVGDFVISVSDVANIDEKMDNLKIFLRDGLSRIGWDKYSELSIDYNHQIVGKKILKP